MNTLRGRLLAAFAYVLVLVLVALAVPFGLSVSQRVEADVEGQAAGQAHLIAATVAGRLDEPRTLVRLVQRAADDVSGRVIVTDVQGRLRADSAGGGLLGESYRDRPEIGAVLDGAAVQQGRRRSDTLDAELLFTAVPVVVDGRLAGAVRVTRSAAVVDERVRRDLLALGGIAAAALILGLALAWLLASSLARPLRGLAAGARRLGDGHLYARVPAAGSTEQREVAQAFNEMAARLERVLAAQQEFVANASHQLRTPLTGLRLRLEAARDRADDPVLAADLAAAEREVERLARLLTALLTLAREGAERPLPRPVDLAGAVAHARDRWRREADARAHDLVLAGDGAAWAAAAEDDVAIVLDNLIENALVYSPPGTDVELDWEAGDGTTAVAVLDRGPGIDAADAELVFERFARGSAGRNGVAGTGLGLAVARTLARRWDGDVRISARDGGGARVELRLPAAVPVERPAEVGAA